MEIINTTIATYMEDLLPARHQVLLDMEADAKEKNFPIIGPLVGTWLSQLAALTGVGMAAAPALAAVFLYRLVTFWVPIPVGGLVMRRMVAHDLL